MLLVRQADNKATPKNAVSAPQNDDDEQKESKDSTEDSFDAHQYIDSSMFISDEDDIMEKLKRKFKQFGKKFQEAAATRKKNAAAKQKMAEARAKKKTEEEAENAEEEARKKRSTDGDYQSCGFVYMVVPRSGGSRVVT